MRHLLNLLILSLAFLLAACAGRQLPYTLEADPAAAPPERLDRFEKEVTRAIDRVQRDHDVTLGISLADDTLTYDFNGDRLFQAAGTMKVPLMIALFRLADAGELGLDDTRRVDTSFTSLIDGTPFELTPRDFIGQRVGEQVALQELAREMIQVNDSVAGNLLLEVITPVRVTQTMRALGARDGYVVRSLGDATALRYDIANRLSPRDLTTMVRQIQLNEAASSIACAEMRVILGAQQHRTILPAGLPQGTMAYHMTGSIPGYRHDTGIVSTHVGNFYITIMSEWENDAAGGDAVLAELARKIYTEWTFLRE